MLDRLDSRHYGGLLFRYFLRGNRNYQTNGAVRTQRIALQSHHPASPPLTSISSQSSPVVPLLLLLEVLEVVVVVLEVVEVAVMSSMVLQPLDCLTGLAGVRSSCPCLGEL